MAYLAQYQEPILSQVIVVRCIYMVYVEVGDAFIPNATILTGHIPVGT